MENITQEQYATVFDIKLDWLGTGKRLERFPVKVNFQGYPADSFGYDRIYMLIPYLSSVETLDKMGELYNDVVTYLAAAFRL